jgi:hypothetical protein
MKRQKTGGRQKGTPNAVNANIRQLMRDYVISEMEFIKSHRHELTIAERAMMLKSLVRYVLPQLAPESDAPNAAQVILNVHSDL